MGKIGDTLVGIGGISSIEVVHTSGLAEIGNQSNVVQSVIQVIIGLVTLYTLLRSKKSVIN